jgi:N-acetylmuramoyl-L-alanine amidase
MAASLFCVRGRSSHSNFLAGLVALLLLCSAATAAARNVSTIVIDAGHGGFDRGGIPGQRVAEKSMTLDVAERLAKRLRQAGYRVIMTRDSDVFVTLGDRARIANQQRDAYFVSIHFNSATREGANGIETYYYGNSSAALAASIHRHVVSGTTTENRGIRKRGYYVLRRTSIPAVLVECGFLTNSMEARYALDSTYRQRLADRIADGIMGKATPPNRPVVAGITHVRSPIADSRGYHDFVSPGAEARPAARSRHSSKKQSKKSKKSSSKKKSSSSSSKKKKKKKSSDSD